MELRTADNRLTEQQARGLLGAFLFRKDDVHKPVKVLSGGEKSRLALVRLLVNPPNLLLMDEPTTHLDMASIDALIHALQHYEGTLIFISHDVHFIKAIAQNVLHVHSGRLTPYAGNYEYYLEKSKATNERAALTAGFTDGRPKQETKPVEKKSPSSGTKLSSAELKKLQKELNQAEQRVSELEAKQSQIMADLSNPALYTQGTKVKELNEELAKTQAALVEATAIWEQLATRWANVSPSAS
jgi:ATP-binding cassette subfamily F protein 3